MAFRLQIATGHTLTAEVIVNTVDEAIRIHTDLANLKYTLDKPYGGGVLTLASLPRTWNVKIGETVE